MISLPGYQIVAKIHESKPSTIYRGRRNLDGCSVILKALSRAYPTLEEITRYKQEYEIIRHLDISGVVTAYSLEKYQNGLIIILEDFGGTSLDRLMARQKFNLLGFLEIAIRITESLGKIHTARIIHKDINPSNIVFNPQTRQLKIIDFSSATILLKETTPIGDSSLLERNLAYISPEQTGRMNRSLDYRTDFYSLGTTFYEMLTDRLPFETNNALELIHFHIAKQPPLPHIVNPDIPQILSSIIIKLLAKNAEERYQSAWGIKADLEECLKQLQSKKKIETFSLAGKDISDRFQIPQKLYGREREVEQLLMAFKRLMAVEVGEDKQTATQLKIQNPKPKVELTLVEGYSGIGKSSLVQKIYKPIAEKGGYFISGKFERLQRNIPYSAVIQAFQKLLTQLLTESETQLQQWREKVKEAIGTNGQIIIDVIPEVELLVGKQPPVSELAPTEAQNRFKLVFQSFIQVFAQPEHPLAIFLDDLQWADAASLKMIQLLISSPHSQYLFLIGAYRNNEVSTAHPLILTVQEIQQSGVIVNRISLTPLSLGNINQLIVDTLKCQPKEGESLAKLVLEKTRGNPFFVKEFLKNLYAEKLLRFNYQYEIWQWNLEQIRSQTITDNVVDLLTDKIKKLDGDAQQLLKLAACIGSQFELATLAIVSETSLRETALSIHQAVAEGLIFPLNNFYNSIELDVSQIGDELTIEYKFAHDRIQQAAYSLIPEAEKQTVHRQVGRLLLQNIPLEQREQQIFDIVNQLNFGIESIKDRSERYKLAQLNLLASKKAKVSAAYEPALSYLKIGIRLLEENRWQSQYDLALELHIEAAEAAYLSGDFEHMETLAQIVLQQAKNLLDRVKIYEVKILAHIIQGKPLAAVKTAIYVLRLLGIDLPRQPNKFNILLAAIATKLALCNKRIETLVSLPSMSNPRTLAAMKILGIAGSPTYNSAPQFVALLAFAGVKLSVKYGNTPMSAYGYASYGVMLCGVLGNINAGYQIGKLALNLLEKYQAKEFKARTFMVFNNFIRHWKEHIKEGLSSLLEAYQSGLDTGDVEFATYCASVYCYHSYFAGKELTALAREMETYRQASVRLNQEIALRWLLQLYRQVVMNLLGETEDPCFFSGEYYDETKMLSLLLAVNHKTALFHFYGQKLVLNYLFENYNGAAKNVLQAEKYIDGAIASLSLPVFNFYYSLTLLANCKTASSWQRKHFLNRVKANQKHMQKWAFYAPANYQHKFYLVEAEWFRVLRRYDEAIARYDRAIELAKENEYIQDTALANELAAKFYLERGKITIATAYMQDAHYYYLRWGAIAKIEDLETRYSQLLSQKSEEASSKISDLKASNLLTITESRNSKALDLRSVMTAAQMISSAIRLDELLTKLMKIVIENAGAQKGFLILPKAGKWAIEAERVVGSNEIAVLQSIPIDAVVPSSQLPLLSVAIVNYVVHTQKDVVLDDAVYEGQFIRDPYIVVTQPKSILCTPLVDRGELSGILYLENNLTTGAFTPERLEILKVLSSQAAISIKNAQLYEEMAALNTNLRQEVAERQQAEAERMQFIQELALKNLALQQAKDELAESNRTLEQKVQQRTQQLSQTLELLKTAQAELEIENALLRSAEPASSYEYQVGGSLPMDAPTYVVRQADRQLYQALKRGEFCYILSSRQMGKSSLRVQMMKQLQAEGYACAAIDLSEIGNRQLVMEQWYAGFAYILASKFNLLERVDIRTWWRERQFLSPVQRLSEFLAEVLLENIHQNIAIFIDEIDSVLNLDFPIDDFFIFLRACFNKRVDAPQYKRLAFVLLGVATPAQLIRDKNRTPFNIGQAIELHGFQLHEAQPLLQGLTEKVANPQAVLQEVLAWTGGQPFLTQKLCQLIRNSSSSIPTNGEAEWVENLVRAQIVENWESQDEPEHLRTIRDRLLRHGGQAIDLLKLYREILTQGGIAAADSSEQTELLLSGLTIRQQKNLQVHNRIYASIFNPSWIEETLAHLQVKEI